VLLILLAALIVLAALGWLALVGLRLWRAAGALSRDVSAASGRVGTAHADLESVLHPE
jgi:type IV secretory pathway TrbD component